MIQKCMAIAIRPPRLQSGYTTTHLVPSFSESLVCPRNSDGRPKTTNVYKRPKLSFMHPATNGGSEPEAGVHQVDFWNLSLICGFGLPILALVWHAGGNPAFDQSNLIVRKRAAEERHAGGALTTQSTD